MERSRARFSARIAAAVASLLLAPASTGLLAAPARPLTAEEVREVPRSPGVIRQDLARVERSLRKDRAQLDRLARRWARRPESDPEGEQTLRMQGLRSRMETAEARSRGLEAELAEARADASDPRISALRLEIARQASVLEDARRRLLLARTSAEVQAAEVEVAREKAAYDDLRSRYWQTRQAGPSS